MPVWVDPFTGQPVETDVAPLGGTRPRIPEGVATYQGDPSDFGAAGTLPYGAGNPLAIPIGVGGTTPGFDEELTFSGGYGFEASRGTTFYYAGQEWDILQSYGDISALQRALEDTVGIEGTYFDGVADDKTAAAMRRVLAAANAAGLSWQEVMVIGLDAAEARAASRGRGGGGGGGGGGGVAAITDEDITAMANRVAQDVLGRNLRSEEIGSFIPAFRDTLLTGTTPQVSAENIVRQQTSPVEAGAHDLGNAFDVFGQLIGGR